MYRNLRQCVDDLEATGNWCGSTRRWTRISKSRRSSGGCFGPAGRRCSLQRGGLPLSDARQPVRHDRADAIHLSRFDRRLQAAGGVAGRSGGLMRRPRLYWRTPWAARLARPKRVARGRCWRCETTLAELPQLKSWPDDGGAYVTLPQVYTEDPDAPGVGAEQSGHVSRAAFAAGNTGGPRGRAALPDPPRHRRPSRRRAAAQRAVAGKHLRRRAAGHDAGRRDAAARGHQRTLAGRRARRPARADDLPRPANCRSRPRPTSASPAG